MPKSQTSRRDASRHIEELSWSDLATALEEGSDVVIVPIGSVEPHGRHAPLGTDSFIAEEIAIRLAGAAKALVFPSIPLGSMNVIYEFRDFPGAISIEPELLVSLYTNIGVELARSGFTRIVFVNGHGPNSPMLQIAAYKIRERSPAEVGVIEWWSTSADEIRAFKGVAHGTHADEVETSLVLATPKGELVRLEDAVAMGDVTQRLSTAESYLYRAKIPFTRTWDSRWVGTSGNMGDPMKADAREGDKMIEAAVKSGLALIEVLGEELTRRMSSRARGTDQ